MDLDLRNASLLKTQIYIKWHKLFFLLTGKNANYKDGLILEQTFKSTHFIANRLVNRDALNIIKKSIYVKLNNIVVSTVFFSKPKNEVKFFIKDSIIDKFETSFFIVLIIKLNQKLYYPNIFKNMYFLNYLENKLLFSQVIRIQKKFYLNQLK